MGDTARGRETQADDEDQRRQDRDVESARERRDESEPSEQDAPVTGPDESESPDAPRECHRRGCHELATFVVLERYLEDTGHGAVEATAALCEEHTAEESPTNLDGAYSEYVFRVEPLGEP